MLTVGTYCHSILVYLFSYGYRVYHNETIVISYIFLRTVRYEYRYQGKILPPRFFFFSNIFYKGAKLRMGRRDY